MTEWAAFRRRRDEAVQAVVVVASAGLGLVRPARLSPGWLLLYRLASAGLAGVTVWSALSRDPFPDERFTVGVGLGAAGLTMAVAPVAESVDERLHRRLQHAGARHLDGSSLPAPSWSVLLPPAEVRAHCCRAPCRARPTFP